MWLLNRLVPDHKTIAEFRRMHSEAVTQVGAELIRFARCLGLVRGEWVAVDGSKFRAVSSVGGVREREAVKHYLDTLESADQEAELVVEPSKVAEALKKLREHKEPEAHFMRTTSGVKVPAYNVQAAVDSQHALIVVQQVTTEATDNRCLLPMAEAAQAAVSGRDKCCTWSPTQAIPTENRRKLAKVKASFRTCLRTAARTIRAMESCLTAAHSSISRNRTGFSVLPDKR
jgi:hypothetical protein